MAPNARDDDFVRLSKIQRPLYFKEMSHKDVVALIEQKYPIKLKYNEDLINRVSSRYPLIDKIKITLIIKTFFQSIRSLLILGKILTFHDIFINTKLFFFDHWRNGKQYASVKIKMKTTKNLK